MPDEQRSGQEPGDVAAEVETAIFNKYGSAGAEYAAKVGVCRLYRVVVKCVCLCLWAGVLNIKHCVVVVGALVAAAGVLSGQIHLQLVMPLCFSLCIVDTVLCTCC